MDLKSKMLRNLKKLYQEAIHQGQLSLALKIIELQAKLQGLFLEKKMKLTSIKTLSSEQIEHLIQELEE